MKNRNGFRRRTALRGSLLLPLAAGFAMSAGRTEATPGRTGEKTLVAYFSRTGNTRVIAGQIARARNASLFEIEPAESYPEDYEATVKQAQDETWRDYQPPLERLVADIGTYQVIFLGFPIWGMTAPPVIRSFLSRHDLAGRTIVPFITHGGYGLGGSLEVVGRHAPRATILDGFSRQADQERQTLLEVTNWLNGVPAVR